MKNKVIEWDLLTPEDIEVRVATTKNGKTTLLLYQDSRCAMRALDKQFGSFGWQMDYKVVGEQIYGTLSIYDEEKGVWVSKSDTGDKSNISEDKGQSSDILKRCAVRWGFAVELYSAPRIQVDDDGYGNSGYKVSEIAYEGRKIIHLVIVNKFGKEAFRWYINENNNGNTTHKQPVLPQKDKKTLLTEFCKIQTEAGENREELGKFFRYFEGKCDGWKGNMDFQALWSKWSKWNKPKAA